MGFEARDVGDVVDVVDVVDVAEVVRAAHVAGDHWAATSVAERVRLLRAWRGRLWRAASDLAGTLHLEAGLSIDEAMLEVLHSIEHLKWVEANAARVLNATAHGAGLLNPELTTRTSYAAEGVVAVIASSHAPLYGPSSAVVNALASGNAVVLKPALEHPSTLLAYAELLRADVPLLQVVTGDETTTAALAASPVDRVCVFGSAAVAARISAVSARALVPVTVVPVGPAVTVVAPDADLRAAAASVARTVGRAGSADAGAVPEVFVAPDVSADFDAELREALAAADPAPLGLGSGLGSGLARALGVRRPRAAAELAAGSTDADPRLRVHGQAEFGEVLARLRDRPYAHVAVFSRGRGTQIGEALRAAQVSVNVGVGSVAGALPRQVIGARGYGPLSGDHGLRTFGRAVAVTTRRRLSVPVPGNPADVLLATPAGKLAARLAFHLRHSLT
ncbi:MULTISPECIES: aldehyde dehydrogenase family protein [unclassified Nocardioides]|uniref:aldehyde dehydrogenase family protein n=1 Tax=unclassified Nocardioides TaxID=2615069 RepID=UPI0006FF2EE9|nr:MULTISPECIES: aldehyde dehydrogenase family protein [unclassified Nocardioides]KRA39049.1 hypothetical protein ASD81_10860 [Nocardioides sp. Root614]KRA93008.1 hypothetical protein ASD84_11125 [Nocardioides sp. Root682]